jgi:hypothetical protein
MTKTENPKWESAEDYRVGLQCYELAMKYRKRLDPRLPAGLLEGLKEDLDRLGSIGEEAPKTVARVKGFTGSQEEALKHSFVWCLAIRDALKRGKASEAVKKAAGVGGLFPKKRVSVAIAAVNAIVETYDRYPDVFRNCGVFPEDITEGKNLLNILQGADATQEAEKVKKKETTTLRNALRIRIEKGVDRIIGAAGMEFIKEPDILKLFIDLIPGKGKKKEKKEESPAK